MTEIQTSIRYSSHMDRYCRLLCEGVWVSQYKKFFGDHPYPAPETLVVRAAEYGVEWRKYEKKIIAGLQQITGLSFAELSIPMYVVGFGRAHSDPVVLPSNFKNDEIVNIIAHEFTHRLLSNNNEGFHEDDFSPKSFPHESPEVALHIFVHAVLWALYIDILKEPERLVWDRDRSNGSYKQAWDFVETAGYQELIQKIKTPLL